MKDVTLILLPQWSPLQPCLSLPSLSAWIRRAGYTSRCIDANLLFYEFLFSDECARIIQGELEHLDLTDKRKRSLRSIFNAVGKFREDVFSVRPDGEGRLRGSMEDLRRLFRSSYAFRVYTKAVNLTLKNISFTPNNFNVGLGSMKMADLEAFAAEPPAILEAYMKWVIRDHILAEPTRIYGFSCIGESQLPFALLFGRWIKSYLDTPIVVGGTIFSRIHERNVLRASWLGRYVDIVVRNEGEKPLEKILENVTSGKPIVEDVPSIIYNDEGMLVATPTAPALKPAELPVPDFDDMPLNRYLSPEVTLPVLSSRGCYWGKCEFCHHGMVYGDKYQSYSKDSVYEIIKTLSDRYGVKSFVFNDEAIPPKILRYMATKFPDHEETGWVFEALIKFEKIYKRDMWFDLYRVGFRSLLIGLESASERTLDLMNKHCSREAYMTNLADGTEAGLHMHCFMFFGFPGETEEDAQITYDFIMNSSDIIGAYGGSVFAFEHNAPIYHHPEDFGLELLPREENDVSVYYDFKTTRGITSDRAHEWLNRLNADAMTIPKYHSKNWILREHVALLLAERTVGKLVDDCIEFLNEREQLSKEILNRQWQYLETKDLIKSLFTAPGA